MQIEFDIRDDGSLPRVYIDQQKLSVVTLSYRWHTKTDDSSSATNICVVDGYLNGELQLRRFLYDVITGAASEQLITTPKREFEVRVGTGTWFDHDIWKKTPFVDLQVNDIFRIIDAGKYYYDLEGHFIWQVTDKTDIAQGKLDAIPYTEELK